MAGSGDSGEGRVVDLAAFRAYSEDRRARRFLDPEPPVAPAGESADAGSAAGLVVEVGRDVWPGTSPLDALAARADPRDHALFAECRAAALADARDGLDADVLDHGTVVLRTFLARLGDRGLPLVGRGSMPKSALALVMPGLDPTGRWLDEHYARPSRHPVRRVRSAATAMGLVRTKDHALVVTRRGALLRSSPAALWDHVAGCLPLERTPVGREAALLVLLLTAGGRAAPGGDFARVVRRIGDRLRLNSLEPDLRPRDTLSEAARTLDVLNWAGRAWVEGGVDPDRRSRPQWGGLHREAARRLARAAVARLA